MLSVHACSLGLHGVHVACWRTDGQDGATAGLRLQAARAQGVCQLRHCQTMHNFVCGAQRVLVSTATVCEKCRARHTGRLSTHGHTILAHSAAGGDNACVSGAAQGQVHECGDAQRADDGTGSAPRPVPLAQHSCVCACVGHKLLHAAVLGEWVALLSPGGELSIWTLCCTASRPDSAGTPREEGAHDSKGYEESPPRDDVGACMLQPVAGWALDGAAGAIGLRLLPAAAAADDAAHSLCVIVQLPAGKGLCVATPLPLA